MQSYAEALFLLSTETQQRLLAQPDRTRHLADARRARRPWRRRNWRGGNAAATGNLARCAPVASLAR